MINNFGKRFDLTMKWYYNFIKCWPELHAVKPSELSELRAKAASPRFFGEIFHSASLYIDYAN
jgi:hypothetical protein